MGSHNLNMMIPYTICVGVLFQMAMGAPNEEISAPVRFDIPVDAEAYFLPPENVTLSRSLDRATSNCGCGLTPAIPRIVGGWISRMHSRPYQVYLQTQWNDGRWISCGGTLLNRQYALTAAHCVAEAKNLRVYVSLGEHDVQADVESQKAKLVMASAIIHPNYKSHSLEEDIALLKFDEPVSFNDNVVPACLPTDKTKSYAGKSAIVSGWGATAWEGAGSPKLKETYLRILHNTDAECRVYGIADWKLCAYKKRTSSCQGDSGGPLVVYEGGRMTVVGAVSYAYQCAATGFSTVYARVTHYLDWINANIKDGWRDGGEAATTAAPAVFYQCDLSCYIGAFAGLATINGNIPVSCNNGACFAKDGSDLCATFGFPCSRPR